MFLLGQSGKIIVDPPTICTSSNIILLLLPDPRTHKMSCRKRFVPQFVFRVFSTCKMSFMKCSVPSFEVFRVIRTREMSCRKCFQPQGGTYYVETLLGGELKNISYPRTSHVKQKSHNSI